MRPEPTNLRELLLTLLQPAIQQSGINAEQIDDGFNLVESGLLDSIAFLNLITTIEHQIGVELALFDVDPQKLTSLGGLLDLLKHSEAGGSDG